MKIALVHDYLSEAGGAERVLKVLSEMYPQAPIYTAFVKNGSAKMMLSGKKIIESKWGGILKIGRLYSYLRFMLPWVWRSIDLSEYDLVITSCSGYIARGFRVSKKTKVVAYCHTPPRWLYGYETPTGASAKWWGRAFMYIVGPLMRYFDFQSAQRVDLWIANSNEVASRIAKFYRKNAKVIYPPIEIATNESSIEEKRENYYLMVARIVGGKGIEEASVAFKKLGLNLKIVGEVVDYKLGQKVESVGRVSERELTELYRRAKGFVALARDEDFGMTLVEAMLCGTPVLAFNGGGYKETVTERMGVLVDDTTVESIKVGIEKMEKTKWDREKIVAWASKFGRDRFEKEFYARVARS